MRAISSKSVGNKQKQKQSAVVTNKTNVSKSVGTKQKQSPLVTTNPSVQENQKQPAVVIT